MDIVSSYSGCGHGCHRIHQHPFNQEHPVLDENPPRKFNPFVFLPAALCDMCGTSIMYIGLNLTFASSFQMLRGDLLIIMAQIIAAVQMVYEERFVTRYNVHPLAAVGWEGFWGALSLGLLLIPFYYIHAGNFSNTAGHRLENVPDAVTKELSATTRMVLDSVRTLVIWMFSLAVKWQDFQWLQEGKQLTEQDRHNSRADEREEERQRLIRQLDVADNQCP
ncbi:S35F6-like protein [Mya arenaria]|uniref:S35F6-like protein n=1 Tax=Mya arenaria TaxID=6604 RepID=A0ABY7F142_MYAAR|nr:S35F6-like protein [Mya arenaria]